LQKLIHPFERLFLPLASAQLLDDIGKEEIRENDRGQPAGIF
jgi:hypothetical protein